MSRFDTGNPLGSADPRDRDDNSKNLDLAVNDRVNDQWADRFNVMRWTYSGMERAFDFAQSSRESSFNQAQDQRANVFSDSQSQRSDDFSDAQADRESRFNSFIAASGYQPIGDYEPGMVVSEYNQIFRYGDSFFRLNPSSDLPFTATNWESDSASFVALDDATLRQELAIGTATVSSLTGQQSISGALDQRVEFYNTVSEMQASGVYQGRSPNRTLIERSLPGTLLNLDGASNLIVSNMELDANYSTDGLSGHGIRSRGNNNTFKNLVIKDFTSGESTTGGAGLLVFPPAGERLSGIRFQDSQIIADETGSSVFGWIFDTVDRSFVSNIYSENCIATTGNGYAHELKNDARHNLLSGLIAYNSNVALAYGQETAGVDGADQNLAIGVVGSACDIGWLVGEGSNNVLCGMVFDAEGRPGGSLTAAVAYTGGATRNAAFGVLSRSSPDQTVHYFGDQNFTQVAAMDSVSSTQLVQLVPGVIGNVTEVAHPGGRDTILSSISDDSGSPLSGPSSNPIYCHATGEYRGSLSGTFTRKLAEIGATYNDISHGFRDEGDVYSIHAYGTNGDAASIAGIAHVTPGDSNRGAIWHSLGATPADDLWQFRGWGIGAGYSMRSTAFVPGGDNSQDLGAINFRFKDVRAGNGTIVTSDIREKEQQRSVSESERNVAISLKGKGQFFKWITSVNEKGEDARWNFGWMAQEIVDCFADEGLDAHKYGMLCYDEWEAEEEIVDESGEVIKPYRAAGNRYGVRMDQLLAFIVCNT